MAIKVVNLSMRENRYFASVDGGQEFLVGKRVTYKTRVGLAGGFDKNDPKYNPEDYAKYHHWRYLIEPTAYCESKYSFTCINTYDRAKFTFGFMQYAAHVAEGDFVEFFRRLLNIPTGKDYFPDLVLDSGRICKVSGEALVPLETSVSSEALMDYLNPSSAEVENVEAVNSAKFIHWTFTEKASRDIQVEVAVSLFKSYMKAFAKKYGLNGCRDDVCLAVCDIRHQGRGTSGEILQALQTEGNQDKAFQNLAQIGAEAYPSRCKDLQDAVERLRKNGLLGNRTFNVTSQDF